MRRALFIFLAGWILLCLQGCSVYFNTYFNAQKAYGQALQIREKRLDRNPEDTVTVSPEERLKLQRAITKSSKVLELWPDNKKYAPKAVLLIAESYYLMEEYDEAASKYAEFIRYFPTSEKVPLSRIRMARSLYLSNQKLRARDELAAVMATDPKGEVRREALLLSARMQVDENSGAEGLALYEKLLDEGAFTTPEARAEAHWQAATIAFDLKRWEVARKHALSPEIKTLPARLQYRNRKMAVLCLYELGRYDEGIAEVNTLLKAKEFRAVRPDLQLLLARGHEGRDEWATADRLYRAAAKASRRTAVGAEAFYRIALHFWNGVDREDSARAYFDSAASAGTQFEFAALGSAKAQALSRILELRKVDTTRADSARPHYRDFIIAEIFNFDLERPDSVRIHLNPIVASPVEDSVYSRRAFYALGWLEEEAGNKTRADSLYRVLIARYPATEWAKQAEKNLGLPPTIQTNDDKAHALFLEAERRRFAGENVATRVIPAYRAVAATYPESRDAAKAVYVTAFLREEIALTPPRTAAALDSARAAYEQVRHDFGGTPYAAVADAKLSATADAGPPPEDGNRGGPSGEEALDDDVPAKPVTESVDPKGEEDLY